MPNPTLIKTFLNIRKSLDDRNYLYYTITYNIAPVIAKKKPSSILNFTRENRDIYSLWEKYKSDFQYSTNIRFFEIRKSDNNVLVLFYHPKFLQRILSNKENSEFLRLFGYQQSMNLDACLQMLKERFMCNCPHEMGIFLGIPAEDVRSFIETGGKDCLLCRYWKVYHNKDKAINTFKSYDRAKVRVLKLFSNGVKAQQLMYAN